MKNCRITCRMVLTTLSVLAIAGAAFWQGYASGANTNPSGQGNDVPKCESGTFCELPPEVIEAQKEAARKAEEALFKQNGF